LEYEEIKQDRGRVTLKKAEKRSENRLFERILPYIKKNLKYLLLGILVLIIVDGVQLLIPKVIQAAIDNLGTEGFTQRHLAGYMLLIFLMSGVIALMRYYWRVLIIGTSWIIEKGLRQDLYEHLIKLSQNFFNRAKIGDLMAHSTNDMNAIRMLFGIGVVVAADIVIMTLATIVFMITINVRLTIYAIIPLPILSFAISYFGRRMHQRFTKVQSSFSALSGMAQESISGIRVVKVFGQEKAELRKMNDFSYDYQENNIKMAKLSGLFHPFLAFIISISMIIVLIYGGKATIMNEISIGEFVAFHAYLNMLVWPMIAIGWIVQLYQSGTASLRRVNKILDTKPEIVDDDPDHNITILQGNIEIKNLSFHYSSATEKSGSEAKDLFTKDDGELILNNISFELEPYRTLAIVGRTGCGKSTIVDLLTRIYNPPRNTIFIDKHEIYSIPLEVLRGNILVVPQEIFLFSDTIANNIRFSNPEATIEEVKQAARMSQIYEEVVSLERGFETIIGERGVTLSGGQKQRIAIARAIIADPNILILDDSLSAVDTKTEKQLLDHLIELRKRRTTIIIAHRISSLQHANKILVVENKRIAESGTHYELLKKKSIYWDLYQKQKIKERIEER
jgi:ATP-binding cassette subfamily B protein